VDNREFVIFWYKGKLQKWSGLRQICGRRAARVFARANTAASIAPAKQVVSGWLRGGSEKKRKQVHYAQHQLNPVR
jgi:hypothetical protein